MLEKLYTHENKVDQKLLWVIVQIIRYIPENIELYLKLSDS